MRLERQDLPRDAINVNGMWLDDVIEGFTTLSATGRETLTKELTTTTGRFDGSNIEFSRLPEREIVVEYVLHGNDPISFRNNCTNAFAFLNVEDAIIRFNDDFDKYFIGTITVEETEERFGIVYAGRLLIICADPFKYSVDEYGPITTTLQSDVENLDEYNIFTTYFKGDIVKQAIDNVFYAFECNTDLTTGMWDSSKWDIIAKTAFNVEYDGTCKTYPRFEVEFQTEESGDGTVGHDADCGFVQFDKVVDDGYKRLTFGDPEEEQWIATDGFNVSFLQNTLGSFSNSSSGTYHTWIDDATAVASAKGIVPRYGSDTSYYHGARLTRSAAADHDFLFSWTQLTYLHTDTQTFGFMALCLDSSDNIVAGVKIYKGNTTGKEGTINIIMDNETIESRKYEFSQTGGFGLTEPQTSGTTVTSGKPRATANYIKRENNVITVKLADKSTATTLYPTNETPIAKVCFFLAKYKDKANPTENNIRWCKFEGSSESNSFESSDILNIDCSNADIMLNHESDLSLGNVENEWEDFTLDYGNNTIYVNYSEWCVLPPAFRMYYRKRWI